MKPCKYCGFVAARQSDEDCPARNRSLYDIVREANVIIEECGS
jgi:hypothetical protein